MAEGHADDMDGAERVENFAAMPVIVTMEDEFGTLSSSTLQVACIVQRAPARCQAGHGRMMDEDDAVKAALAQIVKDGASSGSSWPWPSRPPARNSDCGTAVETPMSATLRRWRTKGKGHRESAGRAWPGQRMSPVM